MLGMIDCVKSRKLQALLGKIREEKAETNTVIIRKVKKNTVNV
jgi:hypothetical protein